MARKHTKSMKKRTHKGRRHRHSGGGWGFTGPQSIPGTPGTVSNPQVFTGIGDCRAVKPGYEIPYSQYGASFKGLPGMSGGKRRKSRKAGKGKKTRKQRGGSQVTTGQRGGRYGFYPEGDVNPSGQAWWAGSYAPVQRIGCEGGSFNPLNPTHTGSSAPPGAANPNYWMKGGAQLAPATYGVGNVDSMYHYSPTAGYANTASTWKDSVGAPVQIQVPYAARAMNQACLTTGGHPPLTGALQQGGKRTRKGKRGGGWENSIPGVKALKGLFGKNTSVPAANLAGLGNAYNALSPPTAGTNSTAPTVVSNNGSAIESFEVNGNGNGNSSSDSSSNAGSNASSNGNLTPMAPPPAPAKPPAGLVMGGKRKRKHHKKSTHKGRKH